MPAPDNLHRLLDAIWETEQSQVMDAMEEMIRASLNGAAALQHLKRFPSMAAESTKYAAAKIHNTSVRQKQGKRNV